MKIYLIIQFYGDTYKINKQVKIIAAFKNESDAENYLFDHHNNDKHFKIIEQVVH